MLELFSSANPVADSAHLVRDLAPRAGRAERIRDGEVDLGAGQDDQIDAAILGAAFGGVVAGHGVKLGVAGGREAIRRNGLQVEKEPGDARGARRGKLPVGIELRGVDGDVVGVALDAQIVGRAAERGGDLAQRGQRLRLAEWRSRSRRSRPRAG